jgi:hypothetical protein
MYLHLSLVNLYEPFIQLFPFGQVTCKNTCLSLCYFAGRHSVEKLQKKRLALFVFSTDVYVRYLDQTSATILNVWNNFLAVKDPVSQLML